MDEKLLGLEQRFAQERIWTGNVKEVQKCGKTFQEKERKLYKYL